MLNPIFIGVADHVYGKIFILDKRMNSPVYDDFDSFLNSLRDELAE
jgi:hypothetical protein